MFAAGLLIASIFFAKLVTGDLTIDKNKKNFLLLVLVAVTCYFGFRNGEINYGTDLNNYYRLYGGMNQYHWGNLAEVSNMEPGYIRLNYLLYQIIPWNQAIIIFAAIATSAPILYFIYKNTEDVFTASIFFICLGTLGFALTGFRQAIAIAVCVASLELIKKRKLIWFIILVLLASTIHSTAIVFLFMYVWGIRKPTSANIAVNTAMVIVLLYFAPQIFPFLLREGHIIARAVGNDFAGLVPLIIYFIAIIFFALMPMEYREKNAIVFNMMFLGAAIYLLRYQVSLAERISFYFTPAIIVLLPNVIKSFELKSKRNITAVAVFLSIILFMYRSSLTEYIAFWQTPSFY